MPRSWLWLAALAWWGFTLYCLLKPAGAPGTIPHLDKLGHFALFAVQAALLALASGRVWSWLPLLAGWAAVSEALQGWLTTDRSPELADAVADVLGAALALAWVARRAGRAAAV